MRKDVSFIINDFDDFSSFEKTLKHNWGRFLLDGISRKISVHLFNHLEIVVKIISLTHGKRRQILFIMATP